MQKRVSRLMALLLPSAGLKIHQKQNPAQLKRLLPSKISPKKAATVRGIKSALQIDNRLKPFVPSQGLQQADGAGHHIVSPGRPELNRQVRFFNQLASGTCGNDDLDGGKSNITAQEGTMTAFGQDLPVT
jgi:hypothetical protein